MSARMRAKGALFVKRKKELETAWEFDDPTPVKKDFENNSRLGASNRSLQRKTQQFCRQVQRALNLALAERLVADVECDLFVEYVSPAPDCGHLLVHVATAGTQPVADALRALRSDASRLRTEVAMAIARKRAPLLCFVPAFTEVDNDE